MAALQFLLLLAISPVFVFSQNTETSSVPIGWYSTTNTYERDLARAYCNETERWCRPISPPMNEIAAYYSDGIQAYADVLMGLKNQLNAANGADLLLQPIMQPIQLSAIKFARNMQNATDTCKWARDMIGLDVECKVQGVLSFERNVECFEGKIESTQIELDTTERNLVTAQAAVNDAKKDADDAKNEIAKTEADIERARQCLNRRRKRGLFDQVTNWVRKEVWHPVWRPIERAVCEVSNLFTKRIENAQWQWDRRRDELNNAETHLKTIQTKKAALQSELNNLRIRKEQEIFGKSGAKQKLEALRELQQKVTDLLQKMELTGNHIGEITSKSNQVMTVSDVGVFVNLDNLVEPLREIAVQIEVTTGNTAVGWLTQLSETEVGAIRQRLDDIKLQTS